MRNRPLEFWNNTFGARRAGQAMNLQQFAKCGAKRLRHSPAGGCLIVKFDVDRFSALTSRYGIAHGEQLLRELTDALAAQQHKETLFARAEDKFFVFMPYTEGAVPALQQALGDAVARVGLEKYVGTVSFSFGAYRIKGHKEDILAVLDKVSLAHKTAGKHAYKTLVWYDDGLVQAIEQENYYNEHLREGIAKHEFKVYLQRQVSLADPDALRAKALVRWALPTGRLVYPDSFIPQFEQNGMMLHLDFYVLEQVCQYLQQLRQGGAPDMLISVNLSPVSLLQKDFLPRFLALAEQYAVPPQALVLELQHPAMLENEPEAIETLITLRDRGFAIAAQTITAGQSNLRMMAELPVQLLKIDRQFLRAADANSKIQLVMAGIIHMAHSLSLQVICEGVEHQADIDLLHQLGCDLAQGYYLMRAVPSEVFLTTAQEQDEVLRQKLTAHV